MYFCMFVILLICIGHHVKEVTPSKAELALIRTLLDPKKYTRSVRPVKNDKDPVTVQISLSLYQLIEINEKEQKIQLSAWITQEWNDYQLAWEPRDYNNITAFNISPKQIWLPDIVLYNNVNEDNAEYGGNMDTLRTRVIVYSEGKLFWIAPIIIKGMCRIKVRKFPFDTQHCKVKLGSWTYDKSKLDVLNKSIDDGPYMKSLEWNLVKARGERSEKKYNCCVHPYPDVTFHLEFQRRSLFYVLNLIFPIALITLLTILAFILPAESGERISLSVTLMLAITVFMLLVAETTPESSEDVPLVAVYFVLCMVINVVIIIILCYISRMYNRGRTDPPMGAWCRKYVFDNLSYKVGIRRKLSESRVDSSSIKSAEEPSSTVIANSNPNVEFKGRVSNNISSNNKNKEVMDPTDFTMLQSMSRSSSMNSYDVKMLNSAINKLEGATLGNKLGNDDFEGELTYEEEWRVVAMTLERILFFLFILIFAIGTIVCFARAKFIT